jgi:hypothetical protein
LQSVGMRRQIKDDFFIEPNEESLGGEE